MTQLRSAGVLLGALALTPMYPMISMYLGKSLSTLSFAGAAYYGIAHSVVDDRVKSIKKIRQEGSELDGLFQVEIAQGLVASKTIAVRMEDISSSSSQVQYFKNRAMQQGQNMVLFKRHFDMSSN